MVDVITSVIDATPQNLAMGGGAPKIFLSIGIS
jgi:hypothetical protein